MHSERHWAREAQCHKEELKDRVACQGDEGHVGFIQIIDRELPVFFCLL